jgi:hypothetical protein
MQRLKQVLAAAVIVGAGIIATTNLAAAQDYVLTAPECVPPPPPWRWYKNYLRIGFAPDWGPFFRHHVYRYGPVLVCSAMASPRVISSKY